MRNDGEIRWNLNDLDVATVEELEPEGAVEVQNLRSLGMGWAWYVNDLSTYLPDADTLADMTPAEDDSVGVGPDVPLSEIALEPEMVDVPDAGDPYTATLPFPHAAPGPAEHETLAGMAPDLLPRSQEVDLGGLGAGYSSSSSSTGSFEVMDTGGSGRPCVSRSASGRTSCSSSMVSRNF